MKNIVLIGMPGAGKSTIGVLLAKTLLFDFVDTDIVIQNEYGKSLCDIISQKGTDAFLQIECNSICSLECKKCVIATGGSAVYGEKAMNKLKENSIIVYLKLPECEIERRLSDIKARGVVFRQGETIKDIFTQRRALYEKYADVTVDCSNLTPERCVEKIIELCVENIG